MIRRSLFSTLFAILTMTALAAGPLLADVNAVFDSLHSGGKSGEAFVRLITDNVDSWYARWHVIANAKKSIDTSYFIVESDIFGRAFIGLLLKKAKEGVAVRVLLDARGTKGLARAFLGRDYMQELLQHKGVEVKVYNPIHKALLNLPKDIREPVASNHDKLVIVDSEWVITGGRNISAHYFASAQDMPKAYRDTDVLMRGAAIAEQAKAAFDIEFTHLQNAAIGKEWLGNWNSQSVPLEVARRATEQFMMGLGLTDPQALPNDLEALEEANEELVKFPGMTNYDNFQPFRGERAYPVTLLDKTSLIGNKNEITDNFIKFVDAAEQRITIQNPYVVLTDKAKAAFARAAARGVQIHLLTNSPDSTDSLLTQALFIKEWKDMMKSIPTLRIFAFKGPAKIHAKVFCIDDKITGIGTYNLDPLSEQVNGEEIAIIKAAPFTRMHRLRVENDMKNSVEYKIRIAEDGTPAQVVGPSDHVQAAALEAVQRAQIVSFLRPVI